MGSDYRRGQVQMLFFRASNTTAANETQYWSVSAKSGAQNNVPFRVPYDCEISRMFVHLHAAPGAGEDVVVTMMLNNLGTALVVTLENLEVDEENVVDAFVALEGQEICIRHVTSVACAAAFISAGFMVRRI